MRTSLPSLPRLAALAGGLALGACRSVPSVPPGPDAESIVEGSAPGVHVDSIDDPFTVGLERGRWKPREVGPELDFWDDVAHLDVARAERVARSVDERTFVIALRRLMASDPEEAAIAFGALHESAADPAVRARSRIGLTMALTWKSDWEAIAGMRADPDSAAAREPNSAQAGVERWAHAFMGLPTMTVDMPERPITLPLRRSAFGTPIVTVAVNGREHEFWLDTGASMTLLSADLALEAGVKLAAPDTLALGVTAGNIEARAIYIDSLSIGPFVARGIPAAVVDRGVLRLDRRSESGVPHAVPIDGVIGADLIRCMDLVIDAGAGTLTIRRPRRGGTATRNLFWVGYPVVRLIAHDGQPLLFGLDTGAEGSFITSSLLRKLPHTPIAMRRNVMGGLGPGVTKTEFVARDIRVSDGDYTIALRNAPVAPDHRWTFVNFDGMIGSDIALATRLHLDFTNGVFDIRPSDAEKPFVTVKQ